MTNENNLLNKLQTEGFFSHNGYKIEKLTDEEIILKAEITENSLNPYGIAHGAFIYGLGDTIMGLLASQSGRKAVTLNANINYISKGKGKYLVAKGEIVKEGRKTSYLKANIYDENDKLIATMDSNYFYID